MKLTPEQLAEWKALVPKLNDDSNDHMGVAHSADMPPEHTVNYRHARNAEEAAFAITALIADLEEAKEQLASPYMDGYEAAKEEYRPQIIALEAELAATRKKLDEAQAREREALDMLGLMFGKYEHGSACFESPEDETVFLGNAIHLTEDQFKRITTILDDREETKRSALNAAIAEAIEPYRKQLAEAQARNAQVLSVAEKMRCAGGAQEFQHWFDELKLFLLRKPDRSAIDAAIAEAIEPYRKDAACWRFARKNLLWREVGDDHIRWSMELAMPEPDLECGILSNDSVARALDAAVLAAIAAKGESE